MALRNRWAWLIGFAVACGTARAELPHLELVRGLRSQGMADLALDYLNGLSKKPPASIAAILPVEIAKTRIDLADQEGDERKKLAAIANARTVYEAFLTANPKHPLVADVNLALAKLLSQQGKMQLALARRQETPAAKQDVVAKAHPLFAQAAEKLKAAAAQIDAHLKAIGEPKTDADLATKQQLVAAKFAAQLEEGMILLDQAATMVSQNEFKERAKIINDAKARFKKLSEADEDNTICWQALVWSGRCEQENDAIPAARKVYEAIVAEVNPAAVDAVRLATYFLLDIQSKDTQIPAAQRQKHLDDIQKGAEAWLKTNRTALNTYEGQGIRFLLANNLEEQAKQNEGVKVDPKTNVPKITSSAREKFVKAERIYKDLSDNENEFSNRARRRRAQILVLLMAERGNQIERLTNFEECYLAAQVEAYEVTQVKDGPSAAGERDKRMQRVIAALQRGLSLVGPNDPPREVFDARAMLAYAFLASGDPYSAAILGEHLSLTSPKLSKAADVTVYALQAYTRILAESKARSAPEDEIHSDLARLKKLATHMEVTWPDEAATDTARHQLGMLLYDEQNYPEAVAMFARIGPGYPSYALARFQQGAAAQQALGKEVKLDAAKKKALVKQAIADLEKLPDATAGASEDTVIATCQAKLQLGQLILLSEPDAKAYTRVEAIGTALKVQLPKLMAKDDAKFAQLSTEADRMKLAGITGRAFLALRADKSEDVVKLLAPLVPQIEKDFAASKKDENASKPWFYQYQQAQREVLMLLLRANIQEGKADESSKLMATLKKITADEDGQGSLNGLLLRLVQEIKQELDLLKQANKDAGRQQKLEKGLVGFLDELAKPKNLAPDVRLFLAAGYASLARHAEAAKLLVDLPAPKPDDEAATKTYRGARLMLARELRESKQYPQCKAVLGEILGTPAKKGWGYENLDVRREAVLLLEDEDNLKGAVNMATDMQRKLQPLIADNSQFRDRYYDFYFLEVRCLLKAARGQKDAKARGDQLTRLAVRLVKLEQGQPDFGGEGMRDRYVELLELEPDFKAKYRAEGGKALLTPPATPDK